MAWLVDRQRGGGGVLGISGDRLGLEGGGWREKEGRMGVDFGGGFWESCDEAFLFFSFH